MNYAEAIQALTLHENPDEFEQEDKTYETAKNEKEVAVSILKDAKIQQQHLEGEHKKIQSQVPKSGSKKKNLFHKTYDAIRNALQTVADKLLKLKTFTIGMGEKAKKAKNSFLGTKPPKDGVRALAKACAQRIGNKILSGSKKVKFNEMNLSRMLRSSNKKYYRNCARDDHKKGSDLDHIRGLGIYIIQEDGSKKYYHQPKTNIPKGKKPMCHRPDLGFRPGEESEIKFFNLVEYNPNELSNSVQTPTARQDSPSSIASSLSISPKNEARESKSGEVINLAPATTEQYQTITTQLQEARAREYGITTRLETVEKQNAALIAQNAALIAQFNQWLNRNASPSVTDGAALSTVKLQPVSTDSAQPVTIPGMVFTN